MFASKLLRAIYFLLNHEQYSQLLEQCSFSTQSYFVFIFSYSLAEPIKLKKKKVDKNVKDKQFHRKQNAAMRKKLPTVALILMNQIDYEDIVVKVYVENLFTNSFVP